MKKYIFTLINIIAAFFSIATLVITSVEFPDGNTISIINSPVYEKTENFYTHVNQSVSDIFTYIGYKNSFENNDILSYDKVIAESLLQTGGYKKWTLRDCLEIAKNHGIYIDTDYVIKVATDKHYPSLDNKNLLNFALKTYPSKKRYGASTEEEFIDEVMNALASYNKCKVSFTNSANFRFNITFLDKDSTKQINYKNSDIRTSDYLASNAFIYISQVDNIISSNISNVSSSLRDTINTINPHPDKEYILYCSVDTTYPSDDIYKSEHDSYIKTKEKCAMLIILAIISMIVFLSTLLAALYFILTSEKRVDESQKFFFALPTELHIAFYIISNFILIQAFSILLKSNIIPQNFSTVRSYFYVFSVYATTIVFFAILSNKYTDGTLTPSLLKLNKDLSNTDNTHISPLLSFVLIFLPIIIFIVLSFYLIYLYINLGNRILLIVSIALLISTIGFIVYLFTLYNAFNKTLKSQATANNMRTALITNITHDIKTPLTSIISYTDLIINEIKNPTKSFKRNITHYSKIVNNKTNHLNDLINDLIFDSKVSTGNLKLDLQKIDLVAFLEQTNTEFKDKLLTKGIKILYAHNVKHAYINADSNQLYRVFQNLYSNIDKYALEKSRVYMDLIANKNKVKVTIKNIQKEQLEVDISTLKERFVRGSTARNTEGFGLGLSITENLIKSMSGKLDIQNIRDEFITNITFVLYDD